MAEVVWHEYRTREQPLRGNPIPALIKETLCGGKWYARGKAPCELQDADDAAALDLPICEADVLAMRELLNLKPTATVCRFKGRASWDDKLPESPGVLAGTVRTIGNITEYYDGVRWITEVKSR